MISQFIWSGGKSRMKYSTLQLTQHKGGISLPNRKDYFWAAQLGPLIKWCGENCSARWKDIEKAVERVPIQSLTGNIQLWTKLQDLIDPLISHTLAICFDFIKQQKFEWEVKHLSWFAHDERFKPGQNFRKWGRKGITAICTIIVQCDELSGIPG